MERLHDDTRSWNFTARRGYSGEGDRPWLAVWLVLLERAMLAEKLSARQSDRDLADRKAAWKACLGAFLLEFHRHPGRLSPQDIRNYLFRHGELGTTTSPRSLTVTMDVLAFFYRAVVPRPALAEAARRPFEGAPVDGFGFDGEPEESGASEAAVQAANPPTRLQPADSPLLKLLREKLVENGAPAYCASLGADWRPA